jgi:uncharacterized protein YlzI (FlbEa/FlbD family)
MKTFLRVKGINNTAVLVEANSIIAFSSINNQTTLHLTSGQEIIVQDNPDQIISRINNLAGPQNVPNHPVAEGILIK